MMLKKLILRDYNWLNCYNPIAQIGDSILVYYTEQI